MSVSPVVGAHLVAYSKILPTTSEVYTIDYLVGISSATPLTSLGVDVYYPNWSRDGANIVFGHTPDPTSINAHLFNVTVPGGIVSEVTPASSSWEPFGFYNEAASQVATVGTSSGPSGSKYMNTFVIGTGSYVPLITDNNLGNVCYWTDSNGRGTSVNIPSIQFGPRQRRLR